MYGHLQGLFVHFLGYARRSVLTDTAGEAGRPDLTCRAPSGLGSDVDWIVLEAKDRTHGFGSEERIEAIFAEKSKYITPNTAWFVMADPNKMIARPVFAGDWNSANDITFWWRGPHQGTAEEAFLGTFSALKAEVAGVPDRLRRFREGDTSLIGTEKLLVADDTSKRTQNRALLARRVFYSALREVTRLLQQATLQTLRDAWPQVEAIQNAVAEFEREYGPSEFNPHGLTIKANPRLDQRRYGADVAKLNRRLRKAGSLSRLAVVGYPQFRARIATDNESQAQEMFATETANLVLARVLLIRFFEDHGFFGSHRYLCNGGVRAFQRLREVFEQGYTRLLRLAYEKAQQLYAAAFDETELDWVFDAHDERLSNAIEWAMYQLSRYDFRTVKGDILTGIYDRFLDRDQRKKFGEFYTPPSIARYIVDRLELTPEDRFLDPACGSGTFLIERYQQAIGEDADRGLATFPEVVGVVEGLAGNDLNTFSAVLAQIQLLWHILSFRDELLAAEDFPDIAISDKANSIISADAAEGAQGRWAELDRLDYGGVGGNPPYVRPERSGEVSASTRAYFEQPRELPGTGKSWPGISAEANLYALFIYRALTDWCRQPNKWGEGAGRLGFVLPLALCGTKENAALRRLFGPNGRWTIKEIIDLEVIWRQVFDADVLPMILIAEARPPRPPIGPDELGAADLPADGVRRLQVRAARLQPWLDARVEAAAPGRRSEWQQVAEQNRRRWTPDRVAIRLADKSIIDFDESGRRPTFRLGDAPCTEVDYTDLFTSDGRIVTRLTEERRAIIKKLSANAAFADALQTYWYKQSGTARGSTSLVQPTLERDRWERREMVSRGIVFAGRKSYAPPGRGHTIYKAENILAGEIYGDPQDVDVEISTARNRYLMEFPEILPEHLWAVARIATCPNAVPFDPRRIAFTDTATIFGPRSDLVRMPFDLLFLSRIYRYWYALVGRMSFSNSMRSDIYPANLRQLPWNDALAFSAQPLEALRERLVAACADAFRTEEALFAELDTLPLMPFRDVVRQARGKVEWSESFKRAAEKIEVAAELHLAPTDDGAWHLQVSPYLYDHLNVFGEDAARGLKAALSVRAGKALDKDIILAIPIPPDSGTRADYEQVIARFGGADHMARVEQVVDEIDALVGPPLGLNDDDLAAIRRDILEDPFLKNIQPRWPGTRTRLHGYRTGLDSPERYA
ncbi:MAG TPA: N-6 DNA methylase [Allosphingosinicella sp.]|nr:N-6 DNA methylase [Allosphingosinicella sp.]